MMNHGLRLARVVAVHPNRRTVDLVFLDNAQRVGEVQVMGAASTDSGSWNVPSVPPPSDKNKPDVANASGRNLLAVCGFVGTRPLVQGFIHPSGTQMAFSEQDREVHRHGSGAYTTVAPDGSIETYHPSGAYLRIGAGAHQDLASVSADGNWTIPAGAAPAQITLATAGFTLTILPNGATTLATTGVLNMTYASAVLTGDITLNGKLTATGDVIAGGISLEHHTHSDPQGGSDGPPR